MLAARTRENYSYWVRRWLREGRPNPAKWVARMPPSAGANARAALIWYYRVELGRTLSIPFIHVPKKVPQAFSDGELAQVLHAAKGLSPRCEPTLTLLYGTGARLQELCAVRIEDVTATHIVLRNTKRKPGGAQVERAIPLSALTRGACAVLRSLPPGRTNNLIGVQRHQVQDWCSDIERRTGVVCHPHKFRATFATHMLARGADVRTVQELMGHTSIETTMRYLAVTDDGLRKAVGLLG